MKNGISINGIKISPVVISTICGHWGTGMMPLALRPDFLNFQFFIRQTKTTELVKSSTFLKRRGNFICYNPRTWQYVQPIGQKSLLNAYSHTNAGVVFNAKMVKRARKLGFDAILNFTPNFSRKFDKVFQEIIFAVENAVKNKLRIIEIVPSCPNRNYDVEKNIADMATCIRAVKKIWPNFILIIKKGLQHPTEAAQEWEAAGMDILHGINTISYATVFQPISPLAEVGGSAISEEHITKMAFQDNIKTRKAISVPMIFGGGINNLEQARKCFVNGADAVSICTAVRCNMGASKRLISTFN